MVQRHDSTPTQRARAVCQMIAHAGDYGLVTHLSRDPGVSRQTLYTWMERGWQAVEAAFLPPPAAPTITPALHRQVLTLLVEGHASVRGIQACLRVTTGQHVALGTISAITAEAQQRAGLDSDACPADLARAGAGRNLWSQTLRRLSQCRRSRQLSGLGR